MCARTIATHPTKSAKTPPTARTSTFGADQSMLANSSSRSRISGPNCESVCARDRGVADEQYLHSRAATVDDMIPQCWQIGDVDVGVGGVGRAEPRAEAA